MAIYIKGVEMPKDGWIGLDIRINCDGTIDRHIGFGDYNLTKLQAIEVPEPHGRLIDESVAYDKIAEQETGYYMDMDGVDRGLQDAPTVIEGSE